MASVSQRLNRLKERKRNSFSFHFLLQDGCPWTFNTEAIIEIVFIRQCRSGKKVPNKVFYTILVKM